jgi:putative ABC transport system permease protein
VLRIALQGLRGRKGPFAGAFVALAIAAALVMACGSLLQAGLQSAVPVERYSAAPIVVAARQQAQVGVGTQNEDSVALFERARIDAALVARVAAVPGVAHALADVSAPAQLRGPHGAIDGPGGHPAAVHPWSSAALAPYALDAGRAPAGPADLVIDAGFARRGHLRVGDRVRLASNGPARAMTVVGIAATTASVERQGVLFVTGAESARLAAVPARVDAIGVLPARGADLGALRDRVRDAVGDRARVVTGAGRGEVEHIESIEAKEAVISIGGSFGGLALLIAMFVVGSTIGLSVLQREREVALLRAVAATPRQVRRMIAWEALLVGLLASAVGVVPGAWLAQELGSALADRGIAPEDMEVTAGIIPVLAAVASSVLTAMLAVVAAGRRAARVEPTRALQDSAAEPRMLGPARLLLGLGALGGGLALLAVSLGSTDADTVSATAAGTSLALVLAVAFLGPVVARIAALPVAAILGRTGRVSGALAASNVGTSPRRFASAMTPLVLTVALSCTMLFLTTTRDHATSKQADRRVVADLVLGSDGVGVPRDAVAAARRVPGVAAAVATATTTLGPGLGATYEKVPAAVVDPRGADRVLDLDVAHGRLSDLRDHGTIALEESRADRAHAHVGSRVTVALGDNVHRPARVVAIYRRGLGFGEAVLPSGMAEGHRTSPLLDGVLIRTAPGASPHAVATGLRALAARYPGLTVGDRHDLAVQVDADRAANDWLFRILVAIVFAFTAIATINTLMMIAVHRTRELALLNLIGGTARQIRAMARWEAGMVVALGVGLGGLIALITLSPTSSMLSGSPVPYAPPGLVALVLGSAAAVGFGGSQLATRLAMRARPADAMGARE